jgi:hypothetical protein
MPKYDAKCNECGTYYEWEGPSHLAPGTCTACDSDHTRIVWLTMPKVDRAKDPYDYLDGRIPDPKPIKSFANDRRKSGKDTT